jgi:hypothetical protein
MHHDGNKGKPFKRFRFWIGLHVRLAKAQARMRRPTFSWSRVLTAFSDTLLVPLIVLSLISVSLFGEVLITTNGQSSEEREFENTIPKHVPIKIKIKKEKEKAFRDLKNEKWARDVEIEVENTGTKPIYFLDLVLELPDLMHAGLPIAIPIQYGRGALYDFESPVLPDDVPLKPGETFTFTIPADDVTVLERLAREEGNSQPKKIHLIFQFLNFGDRTGFSGKSGVALPHKPNER